jgi:hypothetical protein
LGVLPDFPRASQNPILALPIWHRGSSEKLSRNIASLDVINWSVNGSEKVRET